MKCLVLPALISLLALVAATPSAAQYGRNKLVSSQAMRRLGLEREWFAQIQVSSRRGGLGHLTQHVSSTDAETLYEVKYEEGIDRFSERDLNAYGEPIGKKTAHDKAEARANVLTAEGFKPKVSERVVPEIMLYATSTRGMLQAIDGRTGATRWSVALGNPDYPTEAPGANDDYVAAINGSHITLFDKHDGHQLWRRQAVGVPGAGPAVNSSFVFAPMIDGTIEAYPIEDETQPPNNYLSHGRAIYQPVATESTVSWSTDSGRLYVARGAEKGARFRLETQQQVSATPTILDNQQIIAASLDGYVYKLHETNGDILWRFSTGSPIEHAPVVIGDGVYVITNENGMYRLDLETGLRVWWTSGVERFLAASKTRLYCLSPRMELVSLDMASGGRIGLVKLHNEEVILTNATTDRIYLASKSGLIQCLREDLPEYQIPYFHRGIGAEGVQRKEVIRDADPAVDPAQPAEAEANPFIVKPPADAPNPFEAAPPAAAPNPFEAAPPANDPAPPAADPFEGVFGS